MVQPAHAVTETVAPPRSPWPALWALVIGFFMILVDATIVSVGIPAIMRGLDTDVNSVIWVTSAYLLAYAVPLLITGRLGDRIGPKWRIRRCGLPSPEPPRSPPACRCSPPENPSADG